MTGLQPAGFPHSDIMGSMPACGSLMLFAACHVLLRRLVPWHPPCALVRLILLRMIFRSSSILRLVVLYSSGKNLYQYLATGLQRLSLVFLLMCGCQCACRISSASGWNPENDTDARITVSSYFTSAVTLRFFFQHFSVLSTYG